jgi:hypothetical protein
MIELNPKGILGTGISSVGIMLATEAFSVPFDLPPKLVAFGLCGFVALIVFSKRFEFQSHIERLVMWFLVTLALFQSAWGSNLVVAGAKSVIEAEKQVAVAPAPTPTPREVGDAWQGDIDELMRAWRLRGQEADSLRRRYDPMPGATP